MLPKKSSGFSLLFLGTNRWFIEIATNMSNQGCVSKQIREDGYWIADTLMENQQKNWNFWKLLFRKTRWLIVISSAKCCTKIGHWKVLGGRDQIVHFIFNILGGLENCGFRKSSEISIVHEIGGSVIYCDPNQNLLWRT